MSTLQIDASRRGRNRLFLPIALILLIRSASGATYYVATNGNDNGSGAITSPFLTLQRGVNAAVAGDTVIVRDGTYGANGVGTAGFPVYINSAGTSSAPITLKAEHKWSAKLDCQLNCHSYINLLDGAAYWVIQDFDITGGYWAGIWGNSAAHHYTIRGNHLHNIGNRFDSSDYGIEGFYSDVQSHDITFDGNMFNDIGRTNILPQGPNHDHGIYSHATSATAMNNIFYNMFRGWSIQLVDGATNWMIVNNTFAFANPGRSGQIVLYGGNNGGTTPVSGVTVRNNIFYNPSGSAIVTNNDVPLNGCTIDHNILYGASALIDEPGWCGMSSNQIGVNPMLVNVSSMPYDFHLQAGSPSIGTGAAAPSITIDFSGNARPQGSGLDIGALQFSSSGGLTLTVPPVSIPPVVVPGLPPISVSLGGLSITTSYLLQAVAGIDYSAALLTTGTGQATWNITAGGLPAGLSLNSSTGVISGVPAGIGSYPFTVQASSGAGVDTKTLYITVRQY